LFVCRPLNSATLYCMSILTGKHVLIIGNENEQLDTVAAALITYGADIKTVTCEKVDLSAISSEQTGLILVNHLHEGVHCTNVLSQLHDTTTCKDIPVLALVPNDQAHIGEVLMHGAADYFVPDEDVHTVVDKIKQVLGDIQTPDHQSVIDISTREVSKQTGTKVFVVEDDVLLQNLLAIRFEKSGLEFEIAGDGIDLIQKVSIFAPHIIILDLMLPGKDGFTLLQQLKTDKQTKTVPVLIFSNRDSRDDRERAKALGAIGFYVKAMTDLSELLDIIDTHKA